MFNQKGKSGIKLLDLLLQDYEKKFPCVHCGYCCTISPCHYGEWDESHTKCNFLTDENKCGKYEEIKDDWSIGFGKGCSSPLFNTVRLEKIRKMK